MIEAWAAGVPVVATASDGPRALIRDEESGLLVPVDDASRRSPPRSAASSRIGAARRNSAPAAAPPMRRNSPRNASSALYREFLAGVAR